MNSNHLKPAKEQHPTKSFYRIYKTNYKSNKKKHIFVNSLSFFPVIIYIDTNASHCTQGYLGASSPPPPVLPCSALGDVFLCPHTKVLAT